MPLYLRVAGWMAFGAAVGAREVPTIAMIDCLYTAEDSEKIVRHRRKTHERGARVGVEAAHNDKLVVVDVTTGSVVVTEEAAAFLGTPPNRGRGMANKVVSRLNASGDGEPST